MITDICEMTVVLTTDYRHQLKMYTEDGRGIKYRLQVIFRDLDPRHHCEVNMTVDTTIDYRQGFEVYAKI